MLQVKRALLSGSATVLAIWIAGSPAIAQVAADTAVASRPGQTPSPDTTNPDRQQDPVTANASESVENTGEVIVTARRASERLSDVPIAVSVITPADIAAKGVFNPVDLSRNAPGLSVSTSIGDRNRVTYSIRGQGFAFGTLFPAVVTYFNDVPVSQLTAGQFFDLANVQILRGPQGVNFGRVTDGGAVLVSPQRPTNELGGYVGVKVGNYDLRVANGALNVPIVSDSVLFRGAFEIARRDGFTDNVQTGQDLDNVRYESYRAGLILRPTSTLQNYTVFGFQRTHDNGTANVLAGVNATALQSRVAGVAAVFPGVYGINANGDVVPFQAGLTPFNAANYVASVQARLALQKTLGPRKVALTAPGYNQRRNLTLVNETKADLSESVQLTNIFGYVDERASYDANFGGVNGNVYDICNERCFNTGLPAYTQKQLSEELRLSGTAFNSSLSWVIGGYMDRQVPGRRVEIDSITLGILERTGVQRSRTTSRAVYGSAELKLDSLIEGLKINGGIRYTRDTYRGQQATYVRPLDAPAAIPTLTAVFTAILQGRGLPAATAAAQAAGIANATFAPIPHGECTSYGAGSFLGSTTCVETSAKFSATTWTGGVTYKRGDGPLLYAKISRGYRPGGANGAVPVGTDPVYQPEFDTSMELGAKSDLQLGAARFRTGLALYRDRYTNIQKNIVVQVGSVASALTANVAKATIKGVELDADMTVGGFNVGGSFAYTDAKFDRDIAFDPASCNPTAPAFSGTAPAFCPFNRFASTPKGQYTLYANYTLPLSADIGSLAFGANFYHQSSVALNDNSRLTPNAIEPGFGTLNLSVNWTDVGGRPFDFGFFMTNVTNELYRVGTNDISQTQSIGTRSDVFAAPRMYGVSGKFRF